MYLFICYSEENYFILITILVKLCRMVMANLTNKISVPQTKTVTLNIISIK